MKTMPESACNQEWCRSSQYPKNDPSRASDPKMKPTFALRLAGAPHRYGTTNVTVQLELRVSEMLQKARKQLTWWQN